MESQNGDELTKIQNKAGQNKPEFFDSNTNDSGENQGGFSSFYETELGRIYDKKRAT